MGVLSRDTTGVRGVQRASSLGASRAPFDPLPHRVSTSEGAFACLSGSAAARAGQVEVVCQRTRRDLANDIVRPVEALRHGACKNRTDVSWCMYSQGEQLWSRKV